LAQKAQEVGYHPEIILAGRRLNDSMGVYVATEVIKHMVRKEIQVKNSRILLLGITFKENCPDIRNTRAIDIYHELKTYDLQVDVFDPWADPEEVDHEYGIQSYQLLPDKKYDAVVLAVGHQVFTSLEVQDILTDNHVIYDVKGLWPKEWVDARL
jgi:UDP-N-acetyl-D-galactosamine dehydrogenase